MHASILVFLMLGVFLFPSFSAFAAFTPNDPLFPEQWYLQKINVLSAWETTRGSRDVIVAVIDTGVDEDHEDLKENLWVNEDEIPANSIDDDRNGYVDDRNGWDFVTDTPSPDPKLQGGEEVGRRPSGLHHGTVVAGLITALTSNGRGIAGVAGNVRLMALRAISSSSRGSIPHIVAAIDYAVANGASIINVSFESPVVSKLFLQALRRASAKGVVVVAAAGNDADVGEGVDLDVRPLYPVCARAIFGIRSVIGVAATDRNDRKARFSHFGSRCIDIAAPGVDMTSTSVRSLSSNLPAYYTKDWKGTSFATALVSGAAALLRSVDRTFSPEAVRLFLARGATSLAATDTVYGSRLGMGRLDLAATFLLYQSPSERAAILTEANTVVPSRPARLAVTHIDRKKGSEIRITDTSGKTVQRWFPFTPSYRQEITVVSGDVEHDGKEEVIVTGGEGGGPHVRIFNSDGDVKGQFFVFESSYRGGTSIAVGDPNPDGVTEFIAIPLGERVAETRIFSVTGEQQLSFTPFSDAWREGALVASGDVDGDGLDDLVFATRRSAKPMLRVTDIFGNEKFSFTLYEKNVGPLSLALADIDGDGVDEIVTARGEGIPEVRVWKRDVLVSNFFAFAPSFRYGVVVAGGDIDGDGRDEIVVVPRSNGGPHVRIFSGEGVLLRQFLTREKQWRGGMGIAIVR